jgi:hypothetical protein
MRTRDILRAISRVGGGKCFMGDGSARWYQLVETRECKCMGVHVHLMEIGVMST